MSDETTPQDGKAMPPVSAGSAAHDRRMARRRIMSAMVASVVGTAAADSIAFIEPTPKPILIAFRLNDHVPTAALQRIAESLRPTQDAIGIPFVIVPKGVTLEAVLDPRERDGKP